jgi:hypothetical protein
MTARLAQRIVLTTLAVALVIATAVIARSGGSAVDGAMGENVRPTANKVVSIVLSTTDPQPPIKPLTF